MRLGPAGRDRAPNDAMVHGYGRSDGHWHGMIENSAHASAWAIFGGVSTPLDVTFVTHFWDPAQVPPRGAWPKPCPSVSRMHPRSRLAKGGLGRSAQFWLRAPAPSRREAPEALGHQRTKVGVNTANLIHFSR